MSWAARYPDERRRDMVSRRVVTWTALVCVVFGVGCGPDQEPPEDADAGLTPFVSLDDYVMRRSSALATEQCEVVYGGCIYPRDYALLSGYGAYGDRESCESARSEGIASGWLADYADAVDAGRLTYDPVAASACIDAIEGLEGDPCTVEDMNRVIVAECDGVFVGDLAQGEECVFDVECGDGLRCANDGNPACGQTCQPTDNCGGVTCGEGMRCVAFGGDREFCERAQELGEECDLAWECGEDVQRVRCRSGRDGARGVCAERGSSGVNEPCGLEDYFCEEGLVCDVRNGVCMVPRAVAMGEEGEACSNGIEAQTCELGLVCVSTNFDARNRGGRCRAPRAQGESCFLNLECDVGLRCVRIDYEERTAGTCEAPLADGQACTSDFDCASRLCGEGFVCTTGVCEE